MAGVDPYLVSADSILCRVCFVSAYVTDGDSRRGYFNGTIQWGPNMWNGTVNETMVDRYYVLIVDDCDVVLSVAGMLPKRAGAALATGSTCCKADAYRLQLQVALPDKYHRFNIMAVKDGTPKFIVQGGLSSGPIIDLPSLGTVSKASAPLAEHLVVFSIVCAYVAAVRAMI